VASDARRFILILSLISGRFISSPYRRKLRIETISWGTGDPAYSIPRATFDSIPPAIVLALYPFCNSTRVA